MVEVLVNGWVKDFSETVEHLGYTKFQKLIKVTIKYNQIMINHSKPINWRWQLESDQLKEPPQDEPIEGGWSSPIGWRSNISPYRLLYLFMSCRLDVLIQQEPIPQCRSSSNLLPNAVLITPQSAATNMKKILTTVNVGCVDRDTWIQLPIFGFLAILIWSDRLIKTYGAWC